MGPGAAREWTDMQIGNHGRGTGRQPGIKADQYLAGTTTLPSSAAWYAASTSAWVL